MTQDNHRVSQRSNLASNQVFNQVFNQQFNLQVIIDHPSFLPSFLPHQTLFNFTTLSHFLFLVTVQPSRQPTQQPSVQPSVQPTIQPSGNNSPSFLSSTSNLIQLHHPISLSLFGHRTTIFTPERSTSQSSVLAAFAPALAGPFGAAHG